ncbi:MAG: beta-1,6-N-acetylglucosaminyltransferase [Ginsengibacter sp.]
MEKIAYIIQAYKDPMHLSRLVSALNFHSDFYIHIDKKVDLEPFRKALSSLQKEVYFVNKYIVTWGGYSQVLSDKEMLGAILNSGIKYKRIVCINGLDYPIYSNQRIHEVFEKNPTKEFITGQNISHEEPEEIYRINKYYFIDHPFLISNPIVIKIIKKVTSVFKLNFKKRNVTSLNGITSDIYFGSGWYAITYDCAKYVYESLCKEKKFLRYISTTFVPDELCIHTIVFNSRFADNAIRMPKNFALSLPGDSAFEKLSPLQYLEYRDQMKILVEADFENIIKSNKMFFRKSETGISDSLLDQIDRIREQ